ncbi:unnamed protein product [Alopecurus aequalis]
MNGSGPSSKCTPAAGNFKGLQSGGAGGGGKPPRHPGRIKSQHELDGAAVVPATPGTASGNKRQAVPMAPGGYQRELFRCSICVRFFNSEEYLQCHIQRCHVHRSCRHCKEKPPRMPPSVHLHGHLSRSSRPIKKCCSVVSKQPEQEQQQADKATLAEAPARPIMDIAFDVNVPAPEMEDQKTFSG